LSVADELMKAYTATTFTARTPVDEIRIRLGESNPDLDALLAQHRVTSWAYVTAHNPCSVKQSPEENDRRHQRLRVEVAGNGLTCFEGEGIPEDASWLPERSLLILGIGEAEALDLGARHSQLAIVTGVRGAQAVLVVTGISSAPG
jgi:hypothetical protein